MLDASKIDHPIDLKQLKATMPTTTPTILDQISAEKAAGREPNAPRLGERVLALAPGKTRQELYLESPNDRPNHIGIAVQRHLRAGRIRERDGKLYATSPAAQEIA